MVANLTDDELADVLRSALREEYASASDEQMREALGDVMDAMSPAEAFSLDSALRSAKRLASDPTFQQVVRTAAPIATQALGTYFGGPVGGALAKQLGNVAVNALLPSPAAPPAAPAPAAAPPAPVAAPPAPALSALPSAAPVAAPPTPPAAAPAAAPPLAQPAPPAVALPATPTAPPPAPAAVSPVAGGSAAAAQALVLTQQPEVLRALLATSLGQQGRQQVSGIPVAQLMALLSQVFGQAAADADELMYLDQDAVGAESEGELAPPDWTGSLYVDLIGADNLELAEAAELAELADAAELGDAADFADAAELGDAADFADAAELAEAAEWDGAY